MTALTQINGAHRYCDGGNSFTPNADSGRATA